MSNDGIQFAELLYEHVFCTWNVISGFSRQRTSSFKQSSGENHATTQSTLCTKFIIRFLFKIYEHYTHTKVLNLRQFPVS